MKPLGIVGSWRPDRTQASAWPQGAADADRLELRADDLDAGSLDHLVASAPRPVIATIRRRVDGGGFEGHETEREGLLRRALDAGAEFVDVEWGSALVDRFDRAVAILSHHGREVEPGALLASSAAYVKFVPEGECDDLPQAIRESGGRLIGFATGRRGALSRLLTLAWGGAATYGSVDRDQPTADGQWHVSDLRHVFAVDGWTDRTMVQLLLGRQVYRSPSPAMHRAAHVAAGLDARYLPFECDTLEEFHAIVPHVPNLGGLAVTMPFKEAVAARCGVDGAVNTVRIVDGRWIGSNTDGPAARDLLGPVDGARVQILGAGGTAAAVASSLIDGGATVFVHNRTHARAVALAARVGATAVEAPIGDWQVLVQTTPLRTGVPGGELAGRRVLEAVYSAQGTELVRAARRAGATVHDGLDLLVAQGVRQFRLLNDVDTDPGIMRAAAAPWLSRSPA